MTNKTPKGFLDLDLNLELDFWFLKSLLSLLPLINSASPCELPNVVLLDAFMSSSLDLNDETSTPSGKYSRPYPIAALMASNASVSSTGLLLDSLH